MTNKTSTETLDDIFTVNVVLCVLVGLSFLLPWANRVTVYPMKESINGLTIVNSSYFLLMPIITSVGVVSYRRKRAFVYAYMMAACSILGIGGVIYGFSRIHNALINTGPGIFATLVLSIASLAISCTYIAGLHKSGEGLSASEMRTSYVKKLANTVAEAIRSTDSYELHPSNTSNADELLKFSDLKEKGIISPEEFEIQKKRILGT